MVGLRPSALEAAIVAGPDPERALNVQVDVTEMLGADTYIHFTVDRSPVVTPDIEELLADTGQTAASARRHHKLHRPGEPRHRGSTWRQRRTGCGHVEASLL